MTPAQSGHVAVVAAHPDDEVLGCGGTMALLVASGRPVHVLLLADGESSRQGLADASGLIGARQAAAKRACAILGCATVDILSLPDNRLDAVELLDIVRQIEAVIARYQPTTVLTHHGGDVNVDHRIVHEAVLAACRPQPGHSVTELLFFEVPSSTEWRPPGALSFQPNWFVDISETLSLKLEALQAYYEELREFPHPRSVAAVEALSQWRGATAGVAAAEAFVLGRKILRASGG